MTYATEGMKTKVLYTSNVLLREIEPEEYRSAVGQLVPRLGSSLNSNLKWAVAFIEELDRHKCWEWYHLDRTTFYARHANLAADRIDEIKAEVARLINLGRPVPSDVRELAQDLAADPNVKPLAERGRPRKNSGQNCAIGTISHGSNQASTIVRRLKRDHPQIAAALARGEYPSARAAAVAAGICKPLSALDKTHKLIAKLTKEEIVNLIHELISTLPPEERLFLGDERMVFRPRDRLIPVDHSGLHAPPGTREWILTQRSLMVTCLSDIRNNLHVARLTYADMQKFGGWQFLKDERGRPFKIFEQFCESNNGLCLSRDEIEKRLH